MPLKHGHWKVPLSLFLVFLVSPPILGAATVPATQIDKSKNGVYESGPWRYEFSVSNPGSRSEAYHTRLFYSGQLVPEPANNGDYYQTPWGPMYWVGHPLVRWGTHGWIPMSKTPESAGHALPVPPEAAATPAAQIDESKDGVYESGPWRYEFSISGRGSKSEGSHGKLFYNGEVLPEPASPYDYHQTPWGPMSWIGDPRVLWGAHGWMLTSRIPPSAKPLLPMASEAGPGTAATPVAKIDVSKEGVYQSGLWRYEFSVSSPGMKSEGYHGKLLYNGAVLPAPAHRNDYYETPWGPIYWVGEPALPWGDHGWMPHAQRREPAGQALPVPSTDAELIVCGEILMPEAFGTPDRLEESDWVLADLKKFGVKEGHVQAGWFRLGPQPVTIHDTKRWGTAKMRLTSTTPDKPLAVEIIGTGRLFLTPPPQDAATDTSPLSFTPKPQTVELPRQAGATRVVKYVLQGLPFDDGLEMYLAFRVESLGRVLVVGPEANGKTVTVKDVDTVMIRLPGEDPNTAAWRVTSASGRAVEALGGVEFEGDTANVFQVALNGTFKALFAVRQKGRAAIKLEYQPVEQKGRTKAQAFQVRLNVQSAAAPPASERAAESGSRSRKSRR